MYALLNTLKTKPDRRDEVVEHLIESGRVFDENDASLLYLVSVSEEALNVIYVIDLWTDEQAHAEALKDPRLQPHIEATKPLLIDMPVQQQLDVKGGKLPVS